MRKYCLSLLLLLLTLVSNAVEPPKREIRGVWLTTVYGLDWPRKPATTETGRKAQQRDVCDILDRLQDANFNTVFLQVRMRGDVIWRSAIEPASKIFSGKYGMMPGYDPLAFVVDECHQTGDGMPCLVCNFPARHGQECDRTGKALGCQASAETLQAS